MSADLRDRLATVKHRSQVETMLLVIACQLGAIALLLGLLLWHSLWGA